MAQKKKDATTEKQVEETSLEAGALREIISEVPAATAANQLLSVEEQRAVTEVRAALQLAKMFPRDINSAYTRIMQACRRKSLAEQALYTYPKGGQRIEGPSIRLAEMAAQCWGNMQFGVRELSQDHGASNVEAFAWDIETNTRVTKTFQVPHMRHTKEGSYALTNPRDIYEHVANQGARRLRGCILGVIPGDIVDAAVNESRKTLTAQNKEPLGDRIRRLADAFHKDFGVTIEMLEKFLGHKLDATSETEMVTLKGIGRSLEDGMADRSQYFPSENGTALSGEGSRTKAAADALEAQNAIPSANQNGARTTAIPAPQESTEPQQDQAESPVSVNEPPDIPPDMETAKRADWLFDTAFGVNESMQATWDGVVKELYDGADRDEQRVIGQLFQHWQALEAERNRNLR